MSVTLEIIMIGDERFIEYPCRCGCGKMIKMKLHKYSSTKCYAIQLSRDNQARIAKKKNNLK